MLHAILWFHDLLCPSYVSKCSKIVIEARYCDTKEEVKLKGRSILEKESVEPILQWLNGEQSATLDKRYLRIPNEDIESVACRESARTSWGDEIKTPSVPLKLDPMQDPFNIRAASVSYAMS